MSAVRVVRRTLQAPMAGDFSSAATAAVVVRVIMLRLQSRGGCVTHDPRGFVSEGQQRLPLRTVESPRLLPQEEDHEGEDEAQTDRDGERDDGQELGIHALVLVVAPARA